MQNVSVQRKRNPGDTDKNGIISEYREILREAGCLSFFAHPCVYKWVYEYCRLATDLSGTSKTMYRYETRWEIIEEAGRIPESICKSEGE